MKKLTSAFLTVILFLTFSILNSYSQWGPDVRLTNDPGFSFTSINNVWCIAASGNDVHIVWVESRDGNSEIYYKRSTNTGISWQSDVRLTNNSASSEEPSISVSGSFVHVVWEDFRNGNRGLYYKRSTNQGSTWETDIRQTFDNSSKEFPSISSSGNFVHIVWDDYRDGNSEIYHKHSTNGGVSWGTDMRLTNDTSSSRSNSISISGSSIHVVWHDWRNGNTNPEIYYKHSNDEGINWSTDFRLTNNPFESYSPSISSFGTILHIVWVDYRDGNSEIYYKNSTDGGLNWGADIRLTNNSEISVGPSITVSGLFVHVSWKDERDGNPEIYYKRSTDGGITWGIDTRLTINSENSYYPSLSFSGSIVHVVWTDKRDGNNEVYYKRDPTGNSIGIINITSEIPSFFTLEQNYPNPFNPSTKIQFAVPTNSFVKILIYDALGKELETLVNEQLNSGIYETEWSADKFSSGVYFYKISAGSFTETKRMILLK